MLNKAISIYHAAAAKSSYLGDALLLTMRLWIANIFWKSGLTKLDDWETTVFLFQEEYQVPIISPEFAAYSGTFFELLCPILLLLGLGTRFAVLPLIAMTAVIQFTYLEHEQHIYWAFLLVSLLAFGAGRASLDALVARMLQKKTS